MPSAHIEITGTETRLAASLRSFVAQLRRTVDQAEELKTIADQAAAGEDWAGLRAAFGFSTDAQAEATYNLLGSVKTTLAGDTFIAQFLSRLG
jgi:hypothetical protein